MSKRSFSYKIFCGWVGLHHRFYYPHHIYIGMDRIPEDGNAIVMVGNHQNCMMDPLNVEVALKDRKCYCLVRGDVFRVNKYFTKFLHWLGLLPVNRLNFEGLQGNGNVKEANKNTFSDAKKWLAKGNTLILFPEAGHQNKRWLGYFSLGYLNLAFEAAEEAGFEKEVYIMPFGHHYGNYFHSGYGLTLTFGERIALSPYYDKYKVKPRTTMREVNALVEKQISSLMLDIRDVKHYMAIDALRESEYGRQYAKEHGYNPDNLAEKLEADRRLAASLPEESEVLDELEAVEEEALRMGMRDWVLASRPGVGSLVMRCLLLLVGLPLAIACLPAWIYELLPRVMFGKKINGAVDHMFRSTWNMGFGVLVISPLVWILPAVILICVKWWVGLAYLCALPAMVWYVSKYCKLAWKTQGVWRYVMSGDHGKSLSASRERGMNALMLDCLNA